MSDEFLITGQKFTGSFAMYPANDVISPATLKAATRMGMSQASIASCNGRRHALGWKALWVNRAMTDRIVGLDRGESDAILHYLFHVYENHVDMQVRFTWTPGTSALWDNRITIHNASWDYEGNGPRHGTRVTSLAEKPFFRPDAPTRRQALGLAGREDI
ncbi:hypothetical protein ACEQ8H_004595 [Pleosporales sp. CAS-2024a]